MQPPLAHIKKIADCNTVTLILYLYTDSPVAHKRTMHMHASARVTSYYKYTSTTTCSQCIKQEKSSSAIGNTSYTPINVVEKSMESERRCTRWRKDVTDTQLSLLHACLQSSSPAGYQSWGKNTTRRQHKSLSQSTGTPGRFGLDFRSQPLFLFGLSMIMTTKLHI